MPRRKKTADDELATDGAGTAVAGEETSGEDTAADDGGSEESEEEEAVAKIPITDAADFDALLKLPTHEQEQYLASLERQGHDISVIRARLNSARLSKNAFTAELIRTWPQLAQNGERVSGDLERWDAPFTELDIRDHARRYFGGGKYVIRFYDAKHIQIDEAKFEVPGRPKTTAEVEGLKAVDPPRPAAPPSSDPGREASLSAHSAQSEALREKIRTLEMGSVLEAMERRHTEQMSRLERLLEAKAATTAKPSALEMLAVLGPALAPFVPVFKAYVDRGGHNTELADVMKMVRDGQADQAKQMREALESKRGGSGGAMEAATTKLVDLAIARTLGDGARHRDPQDLVFKMLEQMLPNIMERAMDIAAMKPGGGDGDDDDGKISPKWALKQFGDMMKPVLEQVMGKRAAGGAGGPASAGMPNPMLPYGYGYPGMPGVPGMPMVQPTPGVYPYTGMPAQVMPMMPGQPGPVVPASAGQPGQPMMRVPAQVAMPGILPPGTVLQPQVAMPGVPIPPQAAGPVVPASPPDIDPRLFQLMHQALMAGKNGDEVAKLVDDELEAIEKGASQAPRLLSEHAIEILETTPPAVVLEHFFEAAPPEILRLFCDPTGKVAPYALAFTKEFCEFFFDDEETDEAPAAPAPPAGTTPAAPAQA